MTLAERMALAGPNEFIAVTDDDMADLRRRSVPSVYSRAVAMPRAALAAVDAADEIAVRRRALFDRIIAMDGTKLAAMERCAGMVEGMQ